MKYTTGRPTPILKPAARKLIQIANCVEALQGGRIFVELLYVPFLFQLDGCSVEYGAGMKLAIERGWLSMHESGT